MNLRSILIATLAMAVSYCPAPAYGKGEWEAKQAAYSRKVTQEFAQCVVERYPAIAREFVLLNPYERMDQEKYDKLTGGKCLYLRSGTLKMPRFYYQGALANQLVIEGLDNGFVLNPAKIAPLGWEPPIAPVKADANSGKLRSDKKITALQNNYNLLLGYHYVAQLGECIVRNDPAGSRAVFNSKVDSTEEIGAMKAMSATIAGCVASGQTLKFNRTNLRNSLAVNYYRLAQAQLKSDLSN